MVSTTTRWIWSLLLFVIGVLIVAGAHIAFIAAGIEILPVGHSELMLFATFLMIIGYAIKP